MALLVATVTKKSVTQIMPKLWAITLNMVLTDDGVSVIDKNYSENYRETEPIGSKEHAFIAQMQTDIDIYIGAQSIYSDLQISLLVVKVMTGLDVEV